MTMMPKIRLRQIANKLLMNFIRKNPGPRSLSSVLYVYSFLISWDYSGVRNKILF